MDRDFGPFFFCHYFVKSQNQSLSLKINKVQKAALSTDYYFKGLRKRDSCLCAEEFHQSERFISVPVKLFMSSPHNPQGKSRNLQIYRYCSTSARWKNSTHKKVYGYCSTSARWYNSTCKFVGCVIFPENCAENS